MIEETTPRRHHHPKPDFGSMDFVPFQIDVPDQTDYVLIYDCPVGSTIAQLRITSSFGSGVVTVLINGIAVTGIDHVPVAANARSQHSASGFNQIQSGDDVVLRIEQTNGLLNVRGSLVTTNKAIFVSQILSPSPWFKEIEIPITPDLVGQTIIPFSVSPQLKRNPIHIFAATMQKNSPNEDDVFFVNFEPFTINDYSQGWNYVFSGGAVLGQILRSAFIP